MAFIRAFRSTKCKECSNCERRVDKNNKGYYWCIANDKKVRLRDESCNINFRQKGYSF